MVEMDAETAAMGAVALDGVAFSTYKGVKAGIGRKVAISCRVAADSHHVTQMPREKRATTVDDANEENNNMECKKHLKLFSFNCNGEDEERNFMKQLFLRCICDHNADLTGHGELDSLF